MPNRLERVRTGWGVHFRGLALTRIPVKITTPSLLFESVKVCQSSLNSSVDSSPAVHEGESFDYRRLAAAHANRRAAKLELSALNRWPGGRKFLCRVRRKASAAGHQLPHRIIVPSLFDVGRCKGKQVGAF